MLFAEYKNGETLNHTKQRKHEDDINNNRKRKSLLFIHVVSIQDEITIESVYKYFHHFYTQPNHNILQFRLTHQEKSHIKHIYNRQNLSELLP